MRLGPRSLFSRLVLVMLVVLVIAQLLSLAVHMQERGELLARASGMHSAQRIADIVRLFESLSPAERRRIAQVLSTPPLTVMLGERPLAVPGEDGERRARAALFGAMLRRFLGDERTVEVVLLGSPPFQPGESRGLKGAERRGGGMGMEQGMGFGPGMGSGPAMHGAAGGLAFVAQVRLQDGTLVTFDSRQPVQTAGWPYRVLWSLAVLLAGVIVVSWIAVRWATRPLKQLSDAAEGLGQNIDRPPLPEDGPVEVARAARAFNTMQARLQGYIRDRTRILAAMSHDLKTPITRLRLRSELLDDGELRTRFTRDLDEMESMVAATLDFMRGLESGEQMQPIDVMALLESLQADFAETGGAVRIEGGALRAYSGRPQALKRCLRNLIENAVNYGKAATIVVEDSATRLQIRIRDEGPGLPEAELEKVFEPFYRTERSRSRATGGTGLGLTIARSVVETHGGRIALSNRPEGGLEARLTLPR